MLFRREEDLKEREWSQAAEEMVEWARTAKKGPKLGEHLGEHFAWLKAKLAGCNALAKDIPFSAVLATGIELQKMYCRVPFTFSAPYYQSILDKFVSQIATLSLRSEVNSLRSQISSMMQGSSTSLGSAMSLDQPAAGSSSQGGNTSRGGSRGRGQMFGSSFFRGGAGGQSL